MNKHVLGVGFASFGAFTALCGTLFHYYETGLLLAGGCLAFVLSVVLSLVHLSHIRKGYDSCVPMREQPGLVLCERDTEIR